VGFLIKQSKGGEKRKKSKKLWSKY